MCTRHKNGLHCISACGRCHGESCGNVLPDIHFDNSDADAEVVYTAESGNVQYVDDD